MRISRRQFLAYTSFLALGAVGAASRPQAGPARLWLPSLMRVSAPAGPASPEVAEEFIGPFDDWLNAKRDFGAIGDGAADDTDALQRALDRLQASDRPSPVLFLPAGTYKISRTLRLEKVAGLVIVGEHPDQVTLRWAGDVGGVMLQTLAVAYSRFARIAFDGAGVNDTTGIWHIWDGTSTHFPTHNEHADLIFKDLAIGLRAGDVNASVQSTAEISMVVRCKFLRCSYAGVHVNDFNSLLWVIKDSLFEDNHQGIEAWPGGAFAYGNVFRRSRLVDIRMALGPAFAVRGNFSTGSRQFLLTYNTGYVSVVGNTVVGTPADSVAIQCQDRAVLLLDNVFRTSGPAVRLLDYGETLQMGNVYSAADPVVYGRPANWAVRALDNTTGASLNPIEPVLPPTLTRTLSPIVTVNERTGAAIQAAIDQVDAQYRGSRPIVRLPAGDYSVLQTIVIPAGSDVRLVGDSWFHSILAWRTTNRGWMVRLAGPSRATLQDIQLGGSAAPAGGGGDGLLIENADQSGSRIVLYRSNANPFSTYETGLQVEGLDQARVFVQQCGYHGGSQGGVVVSGGPRSAAGEDTPAQVSVLSGFPIASAGGSVYRVSGGGKVLAWDTWYEHGSGPRPAYLALSGRATLTMDAPRLNASALTGTPPNTWASIDSGGVTGTVTVLGAIVDGWMMRASGNNPAHRYLLALSSLGGWDVTQDPSVDFVNAATAGEIAAILNRRSVDRPDVGAPTDAWLRATLAPLRAQAVSAPGPAPAGATDVRLYRLTANNVRNGIRIQAGS